MTSRAMETIGQVFAVLVVLLLAIIVLGGLTWVAVQVIMSIAATV